MGRPKKSIGPEGLDVIRRLAGRGVQEGVLARELGLSFKTWARIRAEDPEAKAAFEEGRAAERDALVGSLFRQAVEKNNTIAAIFLLKARHGFRDQGPADGAEGSRVTVQIAIPAPLSPDQYRNLVSVAPPQVHLA